MTSFEVGKKYYTPGGGKCIVTGRTPCYIRVKFIFGEYEGLEEVRLHVKSLNGVEYTPVIRGFQANQLVEDRQ